ncbi:MAG: UV DNA damage repair endonuclease UvsE [Paenibacillus macerans]|uniref:UV DNA damage repair endonuclease UvsE n=1 Tax=Paenibacillus macerans TaxID=44252 RepID=A0A6N8EZ06_PAEMA|nr:UV DNA damage repair endonuclease UvsE [Paenibacillus macerans]MBS5909115.1 UV DNA damage repair endonuclease UvsE [Paenibacillus macerans]MDU7475715.1 UV DNA damage repair endonuclease UvsE [Paenibacillus macerans]MEC0138128.1 UV DNA damage repair endonuclease UvsE [Paenibacillus macerans]MUG25029.1 UV DNA damage repair endonuclease UvsE [Paenibacillus macerans]UMV49687.1 UV DNA damage repair endonuclease UvsE [Paenibacillus macerans]
MIVRFGYVAMSTVIKDASPSKTMTFKTFQSLADRDAAIRRLERIAAENLHNTLRLLRHNVASDIRVYRFSSKLIPLATHEALSDWNPYEALREPFAAVGNYVKEQGLRVSFHPDHFTVFSTPRPEVLESSIRDLEYHVAMFEAMGLNARAKNNIHVGGAYGDKPAAAERFQANVAALPDRIKRRLTLENDDKTFNAPETLELCEALGVPMVLDIHHQWVNNAGETLAELWPRVMATWSAPYAQADSPADDPLPPKIHASSPKSAGDPRGHADHVAAGPLLDFLRSIAPYSERVDVMLEAKLKDGALFALMEELKDYSGEGVEVLDGATVRIRP